MHVLERLEREAAGRSGGGVEVEARVQPAAVLIAVDDDGDIGEDAEFDVVPARGEVGGAQAHRGAAVTAAPRDVHDQVAVLSPQTPEQVERGGRRGDPLRHQKKPSGFGSWDTSTHFVWL